MTRLEQIDVVVGGGGGAPVEESNILYVYGTLRPGNTPKFMVPGRLYDLGWFPGIVLPKVLDNDYVVCEKIEVKDWGAVDKYEGYNPKDPEGSLYIRRPFQDGYIYEFNQRVNPVKQILSGDWLDYTREKKGVNGDRFRQNS